ncbi:MAG: hypothetical protein V3T26_05905 [candidate division NC10 bacterium]
MSEAPWNEPTAEWAVEVWNASVSQGAAVLLIDDDGVIHATRTRSQAWLLPSGSPLVKVEGRTGGYSLFRIWLVQPPKSIGAKWPDEESAVSNHTYKEAFMLMTYQCQECGVEEGIWNSRDGITPFSVGCRECAGLMNHVLWKNDCYAPQFIPPPRSRMFVNLTMERSRAGARKLDEESWDDPKYPMSRAYESRDEAIEEIAVENMKQWDSRPPDLIEVPDVH